MDVHKQQLARLLLSRLREKAAEHREVALKLMHIQVGICVCAV